MPARFRKSCFVFPVKVQQTEAIIELIILKRTPTHAVLHRFFLRSSDLLKPCEIMSPDDAEYVFTSPKLRLSACQWVAIRLKDGYFTRTMYEMT